jgi:hypothetical protein
LPQARLATYLRAVDDNKSRAIALYLVNIALSRALYSDLQIWEISLRNRLNERLVEHVGAEWPFLAIKGDRRFTRPGAEQLRQAMTRQQRVRTFVRSQDIVADLSAGFWVSLLGASYELPLGWHRHVPVMFGVGAGRADIHARLEQLLRLRNRIAHYEPVFHFDLPRALDDLRTIVDALGPAEGKLARIMSTFAPAWLQRVNLIGGQITRRL